MTLGLPTSITAALLLGAFQHYGPQPGPQRYSEPYIIGLILGPIAEANMRRALSISQGDWSVFVTHPISLVLLILATAMLFVPMILSMKSTANYLNKNNHRKVLSVSVQLLVQKLCCNATNF